MFTGLLKRFLNKTAFMATCTGFVLVITAGTVQAAATCSISTVPANATIDEGQSIDFSGSITGKGKKTCDWTFDGGVPASATSDCTVSVSYASAGSYTATLDGTASKENPSTCTASVTVTVNAGGANTPPTANNDAYNATTNVQLDVAAPGVLGNDTDDGQLSPLVVSNLVSDVTNGSLSLNTDGSFTYTSNGGFEGDDTFTYEVSDGQFTDTATVTITVTDVPPVAQCSDGIDNDGDGETDFPADDGCIDANDNDETDPLPPIDPGFAPQTDFKIMMNYELGMHCTGFEFAYCCVLPAYNSILAQVVKPNTIDPNHSGDYARLMAGDPNVGRDGLGRETVVRDLELDNNGNFKKYVLKYWHEAQPRNDGRGKAQTSTLISAAEGNSLLAWNTTFDSVEVVNGAMQYGDYNGSQAVLTGDGDFNDPTDNYQNAVWNHLYFYENLEGDNSTGTSLEADKIRLGVSGQPGPFANVAYPTDCGPAFHPLGPVTTDANGNTIDNDCGGFSNGNVLTFSGHKGTVVYTQMKVLENLPIMLTSPDIWEALGLPLTPFEDSVDFFGDPGLL
ncbi:MAG: cadherin-like domain-containing protein, partial [Gammaproteobacteria bacterium]|nr:cadherin-like domain-containing protein [Gammaproteobacteria bacterium]NNJ48779.1 cadherin-like domain-containing protein [Gammaproteobacteria bacterium]